MNCHCSPRPLLDTNGGLERESRVDDCKVLDMKCNIKLRLTIDGSNMMGSEGTRTPVIIYKHCTQQSYC